MGKKLDLSGVLNFSRKTIERIEDNRLCRSWDVKPEIIKRIKVDEHHSELLVWSSVAMKADVVGT